MSKIPKIIHQTYRTKNIDDFPDLYKKCHDVVKELHPDFEYRLYDDDDIDFFVKSNFPEYYDSFSKLPRMIMKIDMFRYFLMYKDGGLYLDLDYLMLKPFDLLDDSVVLPCNREDSDGNIENLGNCIFASEPQHKFWKLLIDSLLSVDRNSVDYSDDNNIDSSEFGTGPMFVFETFKKNYEKLSDINVIQRKYFHPKTVLDNNYINQLKDSGYCYGIHICSGLWRNNKL